VAPELRRSIFAEVVKPEQQVEVKARSVVVFRCID
jgi:hypothetical protein